MRVLVINNKNNDLKFTNLVCHTMNDVSKTYPEVVVGFVNNSVSDKDISDFSPSVIIHNDDFGIYDKYFNILIRTGNSVIKPINENRPIFNLDDVHPFITLHRKDFYDERYACDASYVGKCSEVLNVAKLFNSKNLNLKVFGTYDIKISNFCGGIFNLYKTFKMSKVSFVNNVQRLYDCVYNDGRPILLDTSKPIPDFTSPLELYDGTNIKSKNDLIKSDTNFDRMSKILSDSGLSSFSKLVSSAKKEFT